MNILIFGAGTLGSLFGHFLSQAGHTVTLFVRKGKVPLYRKGLTLDLLDGRSRPYRELHTTYFPQVTDNLSPKNTYDLIIVCVKHYQMKNVLPFLHTHAGKSSLLFLNNNWEGTSKIEMYFSKNQCVMGLPVAGGYKEGMTIYGAIGSEVRLGTIDGSSTPVLKKAQLLFASCGLKTLVLDDIPHWYWVHYAFNAAMIGGAIRAQGFMNFTRSNAIIREAVLAARDAMEVVHARGIDPLKFPDAQPAYTPLWVAPFIYRFFLRNPITLRIADAHGKDVEELVRTYYDVLHMADQYNLAIPHFRAFKHDVDAFAQRSKLPILAW